MFFYNETNPHAGMLLNLKQSLYDYFQLVGPVKYSWLKILLKDTDLVDLLSIHVAQVRSQDQNNDRGPNASTISIGELVSMIESLEGRKGVSGCKFRSAVADNLLQLQSDSLSAEELAVLEVLAQYGHFQYEVI